MKKVYVSWNDVQRQVQELVRQMWLDRWTPDYVVGITRGGLVPANLISQYLDCRMETLKVRLQDGEAEECESNLWMAEDAFGYRPDIESGRGIHDPNAKKNILIVDDINDSGATLNWIRQDWSSSCLPGHERWNSVWGDNVRIATLYDNESSECITDVDYSAEVINKFNDPQWIVFPWEEWWRRWNPEQQHVD
jgi:xanthine phosphoribosyltransferase